MAQEYEFRLRQIEVDAPRIWLLEQKSHKIGRNADSDIVLADDRVSRLHASIICSKTECRIVDENSHNGTKVNREKLVPGATTLLSPNAIIEIDGFKLVFEQTPIGEAVRVEPVVVQPTASPPISPPWEPPFPITGDDEPYKPPPGLSRYGHRLLQYLPEIYHPSARALSEGDEQNSDTFDDNPDTFMARFLGIFESILMPIEWNIDNFDLFLHPDTAPYEFLPWLASWFGITFDSTWTEKQRRSFLREAHMLYAQRGTREALSRTLEIYTEEKPEILEYQDKEQPFKFWVKLTNRHLEKRKQIEALIEANKPANTVYELTFV